MTPEEKKFASLSAHMEGEETILREIGRKVKVSEMEMICLVNLAEVGVLSLFSQLDGKSGEGAQQELERHLDAIRREFKHPNGSNGLNRLTQATVTLLRGKHIRYLVAK